MTHTDMTKAFSSNPKLADWVPSEQQIQTITAARELWDLVPEEEGDALNLFKINALDVRSHLHPEVTDPPAVAGRHAGLHSGDRSSTRLSPCPKRGAELIARLTTAPRFLRLPEVLNLVGVTRSTLYRWMDAGTFPKQISVGGNTVVLVESAVTSWMEEQMASK